MKRVYHYSCMCGKSFRGKIPARRHLANNHKQEIVGTEGQMMDNSLECTYCGKNIRSSKIIHLRSHISKIVPLVFDNWMTYG